MTEQRCFFIGTSWDKGAVSRQFVGLATELARRGHKSVVIVAGPSKVEETLHSNPAIIRWPHERPVHGTDAWFLYRLVRQHEPHCLLSNFAATNVMLLVGATLRVPVRIAWYHTLFAANAGNETRAKWRAQALHWRKALVYRAATHLVANSEAARADLMTHFRTPADRCSVFYNSIADPLTSLPRQLPERDPDKIVCVGNLSPMKGQETLVRALAAMRSRPVTATFLGDGPMRGELIQLARRLGVENRCRFLGYCSGPAVLHELMTATASVVTSRSEAFGLVSVEAMATGTPLIATATGGTLEVARADQEALHFAVDDAAGLARHLDRLFGDSELRARLSRAGRARFESMFEQTHAVGRLADWIESI